MAWTSEMTSSIWNPHKLHSWRACCNPRWRASANGRKVTRILERHQLGGLQGSEEWSALTCSGWAKVVAWKERGIRIIKGGPPLGRGRRAERKTKRRGWIHFYPVGCAPGRGGGFLKGSGRLRGFQAPRITIPPTRSLWNPLSSETVSDSR